MRPSYSCLKQQHSIQPPFSKDSRHGLSLGSGPQMAGWVSEFCKELNEGPATQKNTDFAMNTQHRIQKPCFPQCNF